MSEINDQAGGNAPQQRSFVGLVAMTAGLMAITALAIDSMLPALPHIASDLGIHDANQQQWVVSSFLFGFGALQIVAGPLADRFGRKPILLGGLAVYALAAVSIAFTRSFEMMMVLRVVQGMGSAMPRVLAVSIVRDSYSGREMSRVMSLAFTVFLAVPILAPSVGQFVMLFGPWPWIFLGLGFAAVSLALWVALSLPETLRPEDRSPLSVSAIATNFKLCLSHRAAIGFTFAAAAMQGGLLAFINSAQQIFVDVYKVPQYFAGLFALVAASMAVASMVNSRLVGRIGTRRIAARAMWGYLIFGVLHVMAAALGFETLIVFTILQSGATFCFGILAPNYGAMAMEPLGRIAGTASAVQGFISTLIGTSLGLLIGLQFNGTTLPFTIGVLLCGCMAAFFASYASKGLPMVSQAYRR